MRRLMLSSLAAMLLACSPGCRVLPAFWPSDNPCDSLVNCWRANVRRPADWCWGNCPVPQQADESLQIEGLTVVDGK